MHLWQNVETASGLHGGLPWLMAVFCALALFLAIALPLDRTRVEAAVTLFIVSIVGLFVAAIVPSDTAYYLGTRVIALTALSIALVTVVGVVVFDIVLQASRVKPPAIICDIILAFAYIASTLLLLSHVGVSASALVTTSAIVTAAIGFALQDTLGNVIGGVAIQLERAISVGDWIKVNENVGVVKEIRWRQTSIETRNWDTVVIPNGALMRSNVVVLGRRSGSPRQHRQYVFFNVDYRYPPTLVTNTIQDALRGTDLPNIATDPPPHCLLMEFKDSFGSYAVRYWLTDLMEDERADSLIRFRVVFALKRQGITIAIPAYRTFQTEEDQARIDRILEENLEKRKKAISHVDLLSPLNDDERRWLSLRLRESPFAQGEAMARQGDESHCLYIITRGKAEVRLSVDGASQQRTLATLGAGQFFGEMGLMTGEARSATVMAVTDVDCLRLDKEDFMEVIMRRPPITEGISQLLATRRVELDAARHQLTGEAIKERLTRTQGDLLARIRKFFTLER